MAAYAVIAVVVVSWLVVVDDMAGVVIAIAYGGPHGLVLAQNLKKKKKKKKKAVRRSAQPQLAVPEHLNITISSNRRLKKYVVDMDAIEGVGGDEGQERKRGFGQGKALVGWSIRSSRQTINLRLCFGNDSCLCAVWAASNCVL